MTAFENKTVLYSVRKSPSKNPNPIEISQSICFSNQMTGFYTTQASTERYLQTDYNGTCQDIKKKKENYQLNQNRIQDPAKILRQRSFQKQSMA